MSKLDKLDKLDDSLSNVSIDFKVMFEDSLKKILSKISTDYGLNYEELLKKYVMETASASVEVDIKKKKKKSVELPDASRCIANTAKYTRCTKSKHPGIQFCGFHKDQQKYGVVKTKKETLSVDNIEYVVYEQKLYMKEKLEDLHGNVLEIDFSKLSIDCDGFIEEDGSLSIY